MATQLLKGVVTTAEFKDFYYVTVYTPNSKDDLSRSKIASRNMGSSLFRILPKTRNHKPIVISGDFNVAHTKDDLANPKPNIGKHGFTNEERQGIQNFIDAGFIDSFRLFTKGNGHYTWWTHWANARARNVGWRIDYFLVSSALKNRVKSAKIHSDVMGSDHCPISIEIN